MFCDLKILTNLSLDSDGSEPLGNERLHSSGKGFGMGDSEEDKTSPPFFLKELEWQH